jgi:hypothetical protein
MDKQLTIEEGNLLIAEFLGYQWPSTTYYTEEEAKSLRQYEIKNLKYHSDWNWLMPACHKWDCLTDAEIKEGTWPEYERLCDLLDRKVALYEIQPVWNQLVENLQWYNSIN